MEEWKLGAETNKLVNRQTMEKPIKPKVGSEKINELDKPLARLIKKKIEKTQIINNQKDRGDITTDLTGMKVNS